MTNIHALLICATLELTHLTEQQLNINSLVNKYNTPQKQIPNYKNLFKFKSYMTAVMIVIGTIYSHIVETPNNIGYVIGLIIAYEFLKIRKTGKRFKKHYKLNNIQYLIDNYEKLCYSELKSLIWFAVIIMAIIIIPYL